MPTAASLTISLLLSVVVASSCGGTARTDGEPDERQTQASADCVSPFLFEGREYRLAMGSRVKSVDPGVPLGDGAYEFCSEYGDGIDGRLARPRAVYSLPGAPVEQAIVLTNSDGVGTVLLAVDGSQRGWDADLRPWATLVE